MLAWPTVLQMLSVQLPASTSLWNYQSAPSWSGLYPMCGGPLQSPINIVPSAAPPQTESIRFNFAAGLADGEINGYNTGRDIRLTFQPKNQNQPMMSFSFGNNPQYGQFNLHEVVFHWGEGQGKPGSEHEINGRFFDAEAQMVFINSKYLSYDEAAKHPGGLAIVSILMNGNNNGNTAPPFPLFLLREVLEDIAVPGMTLQMGADLSPFQDFMRVALTKFYMYHGSLTQPPCNPVVLWLISANEFSMDHEFLAQLYSEIFQDIDYQQKLLMNRRPMQQAANRKVTTYLNA